ncbi:MAG: tetratricopeptide repeat protein [Gammaproteobacteria bacterium]|nr:tetratricopeptide repeat protein [Gammaproteobacteria bacterium]
MRAIIGYSIVIILLFLSGCASRQSGTTGDADIIETKVGPAFLAEKLPSGLNKRLADSRSAFEQKNIEQAKSILEQAKTEFPTYPQADVNLALIHFSEEKYDEANEALERALVIRDNYPPALNLLGVIARVNGEFSTAADWYRKATELEPQYANAWLNYGILADLYLQDYSLALESFEKYLSLVEDDEKVENWVIDLKRRSPELNKGSESEEKSPEKLPENAAISKQLKSQSDASLSGELLNQSNSLAVQGASS